MAQYTMKIKTRPLFVSDDQMTFGELFDGNVKCHFRDDDATVKTLSVQVFSDASSDEQGRQNTSTEYYADKQIVTNFASDRQRYIRHNINFVSLHGFFGSFFQARTTKIVPTDGLFRYNGIDMNVIQRPELDSEFLLGGQTVWAT